MLLSILKEVPHYEGDLTVKGKVAYVEQEPSIFAGTVKENILFGKPYDAELYAKVVEVACLKKDFENFSEGDLTEIGEKGVTLSGGQKARVNFGRALYSNADIYLLDDPLSAVDSKVSKDIFKIGIKKFLRDKLVVLVTHQIHVTKDADQMILLEHGSIVKIGQYDEFENIIKEYFGSIQRSSTADSLSQIGDQSLSHESQIELENRIGEGQENLVHEYEKPVEKTENEESEKVCIIKRKIV